MPHDLIRQKPTAVSLFSGCGGLDLGIEAAGYRVIAAIDSDPTCAATHKINFPKSTFFQNRILNLDPAQISNQFPEQKIDLLAGGPPCPSFSKSRFYRTTYPRAMDDPVTQETFTGYIRFLKHIKPRCFLLENVKGLAYKKHASALEYILQSANALGYYTLVTTLNAADYGVPQIRERCFVLGSLDGTPAIPRPTHIKTEEYRTSPNQALWRTAGQVLKDLPEHNESDIPGHYAGGKYHGLLRNVPPGKNYLHFTERGDASETYFRWRSRYWSFLLKLSPDMPSWTIQARRSNNMGPFHWNSRILTISEIKRLQSFPDDFSICGRLEYQWRQVGNAVPPLLAKHVAASLRANQFDQETCGNG